MRILICFALLVACVSAVPLQGYGGYGQQYGLGSNLNLGNLGYGSSGFGLQQPVQSGYLSSQTFLQQPLTMPVVQGSLEGSKKQAPITDVKTRPAIYAQPLVNKQYIQQPIIQPHIIEQPIIQQRVIEQPVYRRHIVNQPIIRPIVTQPVIQPQIIQTTQVKSRLIEQPIIQPHVIEQTVVQPILQEQPVQNKAIVQQPVVSGKSASQVNPAALLSQQGFQLENTGESALFAGKLNKYGF